MGGLFGQLNRLVKDVSQKTSDALSRQQAGLVRGKIAGRQVTDDDGNLLVDAGHVIDEVVIERAAAAGKLSQLVVAAGTARMQDMRESAKVQLERTGVGQEARALDSVEEYAEARRYVGQYAGVDVTDVRGNVVIATGTKITEDDVRLARDTGLLSALAFAAQQPYSPPTRAATAPVPRGPFESEADAATPAEAPPIRRKLSLVEPGAPRMEQGKES